MKIRNRTSYMTTLPEGVAPKSALSRMAKWLYIVFILTLVGYLVYLGGTRVLTINARGIVEIDHISISSSRGGMITDIPVIAGQPVVAGDSLVTLEPSRRCRDMFDVRGDKLQFQIQMSKTKLDGLLAELQAAKSSMVDEGIRRALEVERDYMRKNKKLRANSSALLLKIGKRKQEIKVQQRQLVKHKNQLADRELDEVCKSETVTSPISGTVLSLRKHRHEIVARGDTLLRLMPDNAIVYVDAFLDSEDMKHVGKEMVLDVEFPDGKTTQGVVESIKSAAQEGLTHNWSGYSPSPGNIIVRLTPRDSESKSLWMRYLRMEVKVKGRKQ